MRGGFNRFHRFASVLLIAGLLLVITLYQIFFGSNNFKGVAEKTFFVSKGQRLGSIADSLVSQGIIRSKAFFVFVAKVHGGASRLQVGKYVFKDGISNSALFLMLRSGEGNHIIPIAIPEGSLARNQARHFAHVIGIDSARYVDLVHDEAFVHSLGIDSRSLEGYLLPETYGFFWQQDEEDVVSRLVEQFKQFYNDSLRLREKEIGFTTNEVLTLASIVEAEALLDEERPVIAGVYHNRLRRGMKLEADPTIQFLIEHGPRRVLYSDLKAESPYNTYRNKGLPPGPVNNPGKASILAVLYPSQHNYLYFVANGRGGHWFTSNYVDHLRYVRMYRRWRAQNRASAFGSEYQNKGPRMSGGPSHD